MCSRCGVCDPQYVDLHFQPLVGESDGHAGSNCIAEMHGLEVPRRDAAEEFANLSAQERLAIADVYRQYGIAPPGAGHEQRLDGSQPEGQHPTAASSQGERDCPEGAARWNNVMANCHTADTAIAVMRLTSPLPRTMSVGTAGERGGTDGSVASEERVPRVMERDPAAPQRICTRPLGTRVDKRADLAQGSKDLARKRLCMRDYPVHEDANIAASICRMAAPCD